MKTAVSLPDELFRSAEVAARQLQVSRSQLYAAAISEYLERRRDQGITERLNAIYARRSAKLDPAFHRAQLKSLGKGDW
jgi:metal-responsive CopG/Arc/MetJ family transcriptional regulator